MSKTIGLKLTEEEEEKVNRLREGGLTNTEILRKALYNFDNGIQGEDRTVNLVNQENEEDVYNEVYSNFYNQEVVPLKKEIDHLSILVTMLQADKDYFKQQINSLILVKMPLLTRIKMKLLREREVTV